MTAALTMSVDEAPPAAPVDTGLHALAIVARVHGVACEPDQMAHALALRGTASPDEVVLAARREGLQARIVAPRELAEQPLPAIAIGRDGTMRVLAGIDPTPGAERALVQDAATGRIGIEDLAAFRERWSGRLILVASRASLAAELRRFDFTWFVPSIVKYRRLFGEVLAASLFLQLFALVTPLFFQVVMDKVLVHQGWSTLLVIAVALVVVSLFESVLSGMRSYLLAHTTSRIDVELGSKLFRHLMALPQAYFEARRAGESVARVRELENIRQFLTGQALGVVLDLLFVGVFIALMLWYSPLLTAVVLAAVPVYALVTVLVTPVLRRRLDERFARGAQNQSFLVESVGSVATIKAGALEPQMARQWDAQLAAYVASNFGVVRVSTWASESIQLTQKLVTVGTLYFGATLVIEGALSIGQLVAFNMIAGRVAQPIMRLAQLWQDVQQTGISMRRMADILDTLPESAAGSRAALPPIRGEIRLEGVTFRYRPDAPEVVRNVDLTVQAGEVIGIVGRSGSGKSTLTKLIQRLYVPESGRVLVDGTDLSLVDTAWLRRQIGVVLQDNALFARSIRENIAIADPGMPMEAVIAAARLAGAHDFITELPQGYDTVVGERGDTLSGGQRQRIAIARALAGNPRILILDEATSALDYESERVIQQNMRAIAQGRTVIIIAHRLSAVRDAHRIVVMERGAIVEEGDHRELVQRKDGRYAKLYAIQQA